MFDAASQFFAKIIDQSDFTLNFGFPGDHSGKTPEQSESIKHLPRKASGTVGDIEYVYIEEAESKQIIFLCHGRLRGLDKESVDRWKQWANHYNVSLLLHNYPGYGSTLGPINMKTLMGDCIDLLRFVQTMGWGGSPEKEVVLMGNSIGCGPTLWLAANAKKVKLDFVNRVVVCSAYISLKEFIDDMSFSGMGTSIGFFSEGRSNAANQMRAVWKFFDKKLANSGSDKPDSGENVPTSGSDETTFEVEGNNFFDSAEMAKKIDPKIRILILHGDRDKTIVPRHFEVVKKILQARVDGYLNTLDCLVPGSVHNKTRFDGESLIMAFVKNDTPLNLENLRADIKKRNFKCWNPEKKDGVPAETD